MSPLNDLPMQTEFTEGAFQGDMKLLPEQLQAVLESVIDESSTDVPDGGRKKRKATSNESTRWPQKIVPYVISSSSGKDRFIRYLCINLYIKNYFDYLLLITFILNEM